MTDDPAPHDEDETDGLPRVAGRLLADLHPADDSALASAVRRVVRENRPAENYSAFQSTPPPQD